MDFSEQVWYSYCKKLLTVVRINKIRKRDINDEN